jgi:hypothetical protein
MNQNYSFFRSTFQRPNLIYSVVPKPDHKETMIEMMVQFIKTKYPNDPGIVYTYSRKDANNVADALCNYGVIAEVLYIYILCWILFVVDFVFLFNYHSIKANNQYLFFIVIFFSIAIPQRHQCINKRSRT